MSEQRRCGKWFALCGGLLVIASVSGCVATDESTNEEPAGPSGGKADDNTSGGLHFDDALLSGTPISSTAARALFAPASTRTSIGGFSVKQRTRRCNATTGCGAWQYPSGISLAYVQYDLWSPGPGWDNQKTCHHYRPIVLDELAGGMSLVVGPQGRIDLELTTPATRPVSCAGVTGGAAACGELRTAGVGFAGTQNPCTTVNFQGRSWEPTIAASTVTLYDPTKVTSATVSMDVRVTETYVIGRARSKGMPDASGSHVEVEYGLYGDIEPGANPSCPAPGAIALGLGHKVADVANAARGNGADVILWDATGGENQRWSYGADRTLRVYGNKCLDLAATQPGSRVQIWDCHGGANQRWSYTADGTLRSDAGGLCLDVTDANINNWTRLTARACHASFNQQWVRCGVD